MRRILLWAPPALLLAACATTPATQPNSALPASTGVTAPPGRPVVPAHRQYFDQRTRRYYYFDSKAKAYFWEDGSPRY